MNELCTWYTSKQAKKICEEGPGGGKCVVGFAAECMMSIYMGSSGVCILQHMAQGWPRCSACTIRGDRLGNYVWE